MNRDLQLNNLAAELRGIKPKEIKPYKRAYKIRALIILLSVSLQKNNKGFFSTISLLINFMLKFIFIKTIVN